jgi:hypothetical protein
MRELLMLSNSALIAILSHLEVMTAVLLYGRDAKNLCLEKIVRLMDGAPKDYSEDMPGKFMICAGTMIAHALLALEWMDRCSYFM